MTTLGHSRWGRRAALGLLTVLATAPVALPAHAVGAPVPTSSSTTASDQAAAGADAGSADAVNAGADSIQHPEQDRILKGYGGNPAQEGPIVSDEDQRLLTVKTLSSLARWDSSTLTTPYRVSTGSGYTLVLTPRSEPYTVRDLLTLAPQTFVRQADGSYLLLENLVVQSGASLFLNQPGGLVLRLESSTRGFVSIVSIGGRLELTGSQQRPVTITSWDERTGQPDLTTSDGRAYIRALGGQFVLSQARVSDLGFWSGRTGGIALTGTDRPDTGQLDKMGQAIRGNPAKDRAAARDVAKANGTTVPKASPTGVPKTPGRDTAAVSPAGTLPTPTLDVDAPGSSYVSASITGTTITDDAYGLFVASARGVQISDTTIQKSRVDGLVLHRFVTSSTVDRVTSRDNNGSGVVVNRAATGLVINESTSQHNGGNGFSLAGSSLADGPSAMGSPLGSYGNNSVTNSIAKGNAHDGIEVVGGINIGVQGNAVSGNDMGIVVRDGAQKVRIVGNEVSGQARQGLSLRDGVSVEAVGNVVSGGRVGIYARASTVSLTRNTITEVRDHALTLVGHFGKSQVSGNMLAGRGLSALDHRRATGAVSIGTNDTAQWHDTSPVLVKLKRFARPMTVIWLFVLLLIGATAVRGRKAHPELGRHPYSAQMSLQAESIVLPEQHTRASVGAGSHGQDTFLHSGRSLTANGVHYRDPEGADA
ncbi:parallel beta helix pectate lyase-like protein [Motilibacter rhizosphaerae]|uniref:Parallel beta helix pectate lyase-like protein n=1 Tax=Motilibacter rhizosphaerae TaxID=598652 RepID=A0A4Q7NPU3_9ACTN|nr:right-handed parallel beta-helix repeat-containing protein [Motilibacter rhizosphaerae]RZS87078.1 parallel beta helix pectate lyase-like protein [Motilibacter rhizosphaerae]